MKKRINILALALLIGISGTSLSFLTDYGQITATGKAGTIDINNNIKVNQNQLNILNPGDITPLEFDIKNEGNKLARITEDITLSFWIPVRELKDDYVDTGEELRIDDFDLTEEKVLKDNNGDYVKAVPFEIKLINGELPFYITDENGNILTDYEISKDNKTEERLNQYNIPFNLETKKRYNVTGNTKEEITNELINKNNQVKFNIPSYSILDGNKDINPRETADNRKVKDINIINDDNITKKYNLIFNSSAGSNFQDIIIEINHNVKADQWLNQYKEYTNIDKLKDEIKELIPKVKADNNYNEQLNKDNISEEELINLKDEILNQIKLEKEYEEEYIITENIINEVKDNNKKQEFINELNTSKTINDLKNLQEKVRTYIKENQWSEEYFIIKNTTVKGLTPKGEEFLNKQNGKLIIPDGITEVSDNAFQEKGITELTLPESIEVIRTYAFSGNELKEITIPNNIKEIQDEAFSYNKINKINIREDFINYGTGVYADNELTEVYIPKNMTEIPMGMYDNNKITKLIIPDNIKVIGEGAFSRNLINDLTLSNNIEYIKSAAFNDNQLSEVYFPDSLKIIGDYAFFVNNLTEVELPSHTRFEGRRPRSFEHGVKVNRR